MSSTRKEVREIWEKRGKEPDFQTLKEFYDSEYQRVLEEIPGTMAGDETETKKGIARGMKLARDIFSGKA